MKFEKNNLYFETVNKDGKWLLMNGDRILEVCDTEKECIRLASFYEYIGVPFTVI